MVTQCQVKMTCNDGNLLEMIRNKDVRVFDVLYKKYWDPLLRFASYYLEDEDSCEEIVQDLFVHLHSKHTSLKISSSVSSYLYAALRNRIINYIRNRAVYRRHIKLSVNAKATTHNNVQQFINLIELQKEIGLSLNQMPNTCREVFNLHNQHHFPVKKIAVILKRPVDTVEKQLRKATLLVRDHLKNNMLHI